MRVSCHAIVQAACGPGLPARPRVVLSFAAIAACAPVVGPARPRGVVLTSAAVGATAGGPGFKPIDPSADQKYRAVAPQVAAEASSIIDAFSAPAHGPRGVFLVGFGAGAEAVESWFRSMDPGTPVHKLAWPAGWDAAERPQLREVLEAGGGSSESGKEPAPAGELPVVLLSGMSGEEAVAIIQSWTEFTGLEQPAFGTVTDALMEKPFRGLVKEISRAQVRQSGGSSLPEAAVQEAAGAELSSKERMGQKVKEYQVVSPDGTPQSTPQSMEALKEQLQAQVKAKLAMKKRAAQAERRQGVVDETDRLRSALRDAKGKGKKGDGGKPAAKGFGA